MTHDRDDWWTSNEILRIVISTFKANFHVGFRHALHAVSKLFSDQFGSIRIDNIVAAQHIALLHHEFHDVCDPLIHPTGKVLQRDGFRQRHLYRELFRLLIAHAPFALTFASTLYGGEGALAIAIVAKRRSNGQFSATSF